MIGYHASNPYLFLSGGRINGDYKFEDDSHITLDNKCSIRQEDNPDVSISFDEKTVIHGDLQPLNDITLEKQTSFIRQGDNPDVSISFNNRTVIDGDVVVNGQILAMNLAPGTGDQTLPTEVSFDVVATKELQKNPSEPGIFTDFLIPYGIETAGVDGNIKADSMDARVLRVEDIEGQENSPPNFPSGAMTDSADGFRSNNYKTRDGAGMMSSDGSKITLWQNVHSNGDVTLSGGKKVSADVLYTNNIHSNTGSSFNVHNTMKLPSSVDVSDPFKSTIQLDYIRGNDHPTIPGDPMTLEIRSDLRMGQNLVTLTQYKLLGDIVVQDKLESASNYFNNIHTLTGDTIHMHDKVELKLGVTMVDGATIHGNLDLPDENSQVTAKSGHFPAIGTSGIISADPEDQFENHVIRFHSDLDLQGYQHIQNAKTVHCEHVDADTGDFTSVTAGTVTLTSEISSPQYSGMHMNLTGHVHVNNVSASLYYMFSNGDYRSLFTANHVDNELHLNEEWFPTLQVLNLNVSTFAPNDSTNVLTFKDYDTIDFGNANFVHWPHADGGGDQFPFVNNEYQIDHGINVDGAVETTGNLTTHVLTCNHLSATEYQLRSSGVSKRLFWVEHPGELKFDINNFSTVDAYRFQAMYVATPDIETFKIHGGSTPQKLIFENFTEIDFGNLPITHWSGPTGSGGFSLNQAGTDYLVPHGLDVDGNISLSEPSKGLFCNIIGPSDITEEIKVLTILGFDQIDFMDTEITGWNMPTLESITAEDVKTERLHMEIGGSDLYAEVMRMGIDKDLHFPSLDIDLIDFNDIPLKSVRIHENDQVVFKHDLQGNAHIQCEELNGQPVITVYPTMNTQRMFVTDVGYRKNDTTRSVQETIENDTDIFPFHPMQNGEGIRFQQNRFSVMASDYWGLPSPYLFNNNFPLQKNAFGKNCALEVFCKHQYWKDQSNFDCGDFDWPVFQVSANPRIMTGAHRHLVLDDVFEEWPDTHKQERPSCVSINKPNRFTPELACDVMPPTTATTLVEPDAMVIRFGYTDQSQVWGTDWDTDYYPNAGLYESSGMSTNERGISFREPDWSDHMVGGVREVLHIGKKKSTFGCALHNAWLGTKNLDNNKNPLVTIGFWNWPELKEQHNNDMLNRDQLVVLGNIRCWGGGVAHSINYTLSHHCETDEDRDWDALKGRVLSYTGEPGGNDGGVQITDWKHGIHNHALSTVGLSTVQEDVNYAGVCQGLTADTGDTDITLTHHIKHFTKYHGERQTVSVADRGDTMVWLVIPLGSEIPVDAAMLSGSYDKSVNAVPTGDKVIINVNPDLSFTVTESIASIMEALAALQAQVDELTNN